MNNLNRRENEDSKFVPGSESWLGGPVVEELQEHDEPMNTTEKLPEGVGLDGEGFTPIPRNHTFEKNVEVLAEAEIIPERIEKIAQMISPIFRDSISQGVVEGWDAATNRPSDLFVEKVGASLEKMIKDRTAGWREDCMVYELLINEPLPVQNEKTKTMRDALIKRASRSCTH